MWELITWRLTKWELTSCKEVILRSPRGEWLVTKHTSNTYSHHFPHSPLALWTQNWWPWELWPSPHCWSSQPYLTPIISCFALPVNCAFGWVDHSLTGKTTILLVLPAEFSTTSSFLHFPISSFPVPPFRPINPWLMSCFNIGCDFVHRLRLGAPLIGFCSNL